MQEVRLAIIFMLLENLKSTYAHENGIPFINGHFRKPDKLGKLNSRSPIHHFNELLAEMLRSVGMEYDLSKIIALRNDIFHSAISEQPFERQRETYEDCQDLAREYLLRLLGYHGSFFLYKSRCTVVKHH